MDSIFCKKCEHGNPVYLQYCSNCNAELLTSVDADSFAPYAADSAPHPKPEINEETLRRNTLVAIVLWCFTTIFKIWLLVSLDASVHSRYVPSISDVLLIIAPLIVAVVVAKKSKRWYRVLFADSILMTLVFVVNLLLLIVIALSKKGR